MRNKVTPAEYFAFLSTKYNVDPDKLFYALVSAEKNQKSTCGNLLIERRDKKKNRTTILITKGQKAVAQFPIPKDFLLRQSNPIKDAKENGVLQRRLAKKNNESQFLQIKDLRIGMKKVNLKAEIVEIAKPTHVFTRFGNYASVANALIADETGTIKLCLWNEQINFVSTGDTVQIENANISTFRGERQLRIGKKGNLLQLHDAKNGKN